VAQDEKGNKKMNRRRRS